MLWAQKLSTNQESEVRSEKSGVRSQKSEVRRERIFTAATYATFVLAVDQKQWHNLRL